MILYYTMYKIEIKELYVFFNSINIFLLSKDIASFTD